MGAAKAARVKGNLMMLSSSASTGVEEVNEAYGEPVWYQLYTRPDWESTEKLIKRVDDGGLPGPGVDDRQSRRPKHGHPQTWAGARRL